MIAMERFYCLAGITFRITGDPDQLYLDGDPLDQYRAEGPRYDHSMEFSIVSSLPKPTGECLFSKPSFQVYGDGETQTICVGDGLQMPEATYLQIRRQGNHSNVQVMRRAVPDWIRSKLVLNSMELEHHLAQRRGFLLHASFIKWKNSAILFTAPSGTGKSTQAELWRNLRGAEIINGDRCAVTVEKEAITAWGVPFCGTSGIFRNTSAPLAAIVYLSQAPESSVNKLTGFRAFRCIWEGCSVNVWNKADVAHCTGAVEETVQRIPILHLSCTPDETAVRVLEECLRREA